MCVTAASTLSLEMHQDIYTESTEVSFISIPYQYLYIADYEYPYQQIFLADNVFVIS
jgi:hypothetical protein